jgi:gluconokinase
MDGNEYVLAVDIGTGATKAVAFDCELRLASIARKHYPILVVQKGWSEQEPEVIWGAVLGAMRELIAALPQGAHILGIAFSAQMYNILAVDSTGKALTNSLTWSDTRGAQIAREVRNLPEAQEIFQSTGDPIDAIYPLIKILWMRRNLDLPADVRFISIKDYVIHKFTGRYVVDWSMASASGMFDVRNQSWDEKALALLQITPAQLSEPVSPRQIFHHIDEAVVRQIGLPTNTPLIIGGGDGPLASIGVGACDDHVLAVNVGSSAAARLIIAEPWIDPTGSLYTQVADEHRWVVGGVVSSGGIVYEWFLNQYLTKSIQGDPAVGLDDIHEEAERAAAETPPGANGLIFIPYLAGEQCPGWAPETRGAFWGLDFRHQRGDMIRAVLEGITFSIYRIIERIQASHVTPFNEVRVSGGLTSSALWLQIAADVFGYPVVVPATSEGSARGAAALALLALGRRAGLNDFADRFDERTRLLPRNEIHSLYLQQYKKFLKLLDCSRDI